MVCLQRVMNHLVMIRRITIKSHQQASSMILIVATHGCRCQVGRDVLCVEKRARTKGLKLCDANIVYICNAFNTTWYYWCKPTKTLDAHNVERYTIRQLVMYLELSNRTELTRLNLVRILINRKSLIVDLFYIRCLLKNKEENALVETWQTVLYFLM